MENTTTKKKTVKATSKKTVSKKELTFNERIKELSKPLEIDNIDFRIQSINNGGYATILAYKDARVDMQRLDDTVGVLNWKREHTRENSNCIVSVWCEDKKTWVSKEDTGTESAAEAQKGLASDSFKRACFNWGIGRELYSYPIISIKLNSNEITETGKPKPKYRASFNLKIKEWKWETKWDGIKLIKLIAKDSTGKVRFTFSNENLLKALGDDIKDCKTVDELTNLWKANSTLHKNQEFINAVTSRKAELK